jgi:peptidoglycan hydrolase CwlO-like protein
MKTTITFGNLLAILVPVFIIILTWGNSVETRLTEHSIKIEANTKNYMEIKKSLQDLDNKIDKVLIALENKKDRE